jgi:hypothetical protein
MQPSNELDATCVNEVPRRLSVETGYADARKLEQFARAKVAERMAS